MKELYIDKTFRTDSLELIFTMNRIIDDYVAQGFRLTVRQLYYQLVARAVIENTEKSYKRITSIVNDAKMAGLMDWEAIEDRTRAFIRTNRWQSGEQILRAVAKQYHEDMWDNQDARIFVIVEKEALAGVLEGVCGEWDMPLLAARGYPSGTVLREFAESDLIETLNNGQRAIILHLGDHDPSGIDMTRDLDERLALFARASDLQDGDLQLIRIALNMAQIEEQRPPENPAKTTDSRFRDYRRKFGSASWELDALQPEYLARLVRSHVADYVDLDRWKQRETEIAATREKILKVAETFEGWGE